MHIVVDALQWFCGASSVFFVRIDFKRYVEHLVSVAVMPYNGHGLL